MHKKINISMYVEYSLLGLCSVKKRGSYYLLERERQMLELIVETFDNN